MHIEHLPTELRIDLDSEAETDRLGAVIASTIEPGTVIGLSGPLGAGKTRLVRAIATSLGVDPRAISSPTFVLVHEYEGRIPVFHFDAYRLGGPEPFEALGVAEYWDAGGVCLVEWADLVRDVLPRSAWSIRIEPTGPESRRVWLVTPVDQSLLASTLAQV
jgi:tRNA threonylcarbamoyladenosine biosynthesis protein TsaE